jgi:GNAT superfamily N-acetyltransferase
MNPNNQVTTIDNPNQDQLTSIKSWLREEYEEKEAGFYGNWEAIEKAFENNRMVILAKDSEPVAFLTYRFEELTARIEIMEVHPNYRKKGYGRILFNDFIKIARESKAIVIDLYCSPEESQEFWESVGFELYPEMPHNRTKIWMYKPLVKTATVVEVSFDEEVLELSYSNSDGINTPTWLVERHEVTDLLTKPIIFPVDDNWNICWRKGRTIFFNGSIIDFKESSISYGDFLIVRELKCSR